MHSHHDSTTFNISVVIGISFVLISVLFFLLFSFKILKWLGYLVQSSFTRCCNRQFLDGCAGTQERQFSKQCTKQKLTIFDPLVAFIPQNSTRERVTNGNRFTYTTSQPAKRASQHLYCNLTFRLSFAIRKYPFWAKIFCLFKILCCEKISLTVADYHSAFRYFRTQKFGLNFGSAAFFFFSVCPQKFSHNKAEGPSWHCVPWFWVLSASFGLKMTYVECWCNFRIFVQFFCTYLLTHKLLLYYYFVFLLSHMGPIVSKRHSSCYLLGTLLLESLAYCCAFVYDFPYINLLPLILIFLQDNTYQEGTVNLTNLDFVRISLLILCLLFLIVL